LGNLATKIIELVAEAAAGMNSLFPQRSFFF